MFYVMILQETDLSVLQASPLTAMPAPVRLAAYLFIPFATVRNLNWWGNPLKASAAVLYEQRFLYRELRLSYGSTCSRSPSAALLYLRYYVISGSPFYLMLPSNAFIYY